MHRSVYDKLKSQVEKRGRGAVFVTREFLPLGSRAASTRHSLVWPRKAPSDASGAASTTIPAFTLRSAPSPAQPDEIAAALARKTGSRIQSTGGRAANALGVSHQVAARPVYLTDGRGRTVQVGGQSIELRHASPRAMAGAGRAEGAVIQALRHLGPKTTSIRLPSSGCGWR